MLRPEQPLAIFMEDHLGKPQGKMGYGVLRYSQNPITCVIDSRHDGKRVTDVLDLPRDCPVVGNVRAAKELGADALILGIAPSGGLLPDAWMPEIDTAVELGMSVVNGLHTRLAPRYPTLGNGQWIWDIRQEPKNLGIATGEARTFGNRRLLMIGTDMATGKMTAGFEICEGARARGVSTEFLATGQIGIVITGKGIPLDAVRLDYACGAVEQLVKMGADAELEVIEGQGSIIHPGSTATLPLIRGACPTHFILCHRADQTHLMKVPWVKIPPLADCARLYEDIAETCGLYDRPKTAGISLNTWHLPEPEALDAIARTEDETGLPTTDPVRFGVDKLLDSLLSS